MIRLLCVFVAILVTFNPMKRRGVPEELVQVPVLHVLKHHDERIALHTHAVERDDVLVLQVGQQLRFTVEILPGIFTGLFKCLQIHTQTHNDDILIERGMKVPFIMK